MKPSGLFFFFQVYLFMAALGLQCCAWVLSTCGHPGFSCFDVWASFVSMCGLLIAAVYLVLENELYGTQA